jgi:hypothetical protein
MRCLAGDDEGNNTMSFLPHVTRRFDWRHTHNASVRGEVTPLSAEPLLVPGAGAGGQDVDFLLLYERDATRPSWAIRVDDGSLWRLRSNITPETPAGPGTEEVPNGVVVEHGDCVVREEPRLFRWKSDGKVYELVTAWPDGTMMLRPHRPARAFWGNLIAKPADVDPV